MNVRSTATSLDRNLHTHGLRATLYDVAVRATNTFVNWKDIQCIMINDPDPQCTNVEPPYQYAILDRQALLSFSEKNEYELSREFVVNALDKGDECHALLLGDTLASYGWYSAQPTLFNDELRFHFRQDYRYMYKGFTLPSHRGHRLHAIGMTLALMKYRSAGSKGLVSLVEMNNFNSLKSCYRMGYVPCGNIRFIKVAGRYLIHVDAASQFHDLDLRPLPNVRVGSAKPS